MKQYVLEIKSALQNVLDTGNRFLRPCTYERAITSCELLMLWGAAQNTIRCSEDSVNSLLYDDFDDDGGAEKHVIIPSSFDFVIKFIDNYESIREPELYQKSVEVGLDRYFLPSLHPFTFKLIDCKKTTVSVSGYFQKKIPVGRDDFSEPFDEDVQNLIFKKSHNWSKENRGRNDIIYGPQLAAIIAGMGKDLAIKFMDFLTSNNINDLHNQNYLYVKDHGLLIFDYSGFMGSNYSYSYGYSYSYILNGSS